MSNRFAKTRPARIAKAAIALAAAAGCFLCVTAARGQQAPPAGVTFKVRGANERLEMVVNGSRVVEFPYEVPRMMVNNPDVIRVSPISSRPNRWTTRTSRTLKFASAACASFSISLRAMDS